MAGGTDVGEGLKWWERVLSSPAVVAAVDGVSGSPSPSAGYQPVEATKPEPTNQDSEPYLLRVVRNPASQNVLLLTAVIVGGLWALNSMRKG